MHKVIIILMMMSVLVVSACSGGKKGNSFYKGNPEPLVQNTYIRLPLGSVKPEGWLRDQLMAQAEGLTGNVDDFWPDLVNSAWRNGTGESWERGPYFLDGLVPLEIGRASCRERV